MGRSVSVVKRCILIILGTLCLGLGFLGIVVRLLPTTPLLLLGSWCYVQSSPKLHQRLVQSHLYKRYGARFAEEGGLSLRSKSFLLLWVWILIILIFFLTENTRVKGLALLLGIGKTLFFTLVIKTVPQHPKDR